MKMLITGGAGYKGVKLARRMLEAGHDVTVLDNFMYGEEPSIPLLEFPRFSAVRKDIRNLEREDVKDAEIIFHLAGISGYPACEANPHSAQQINVVGTERLCALLEPEQMVINASTTSFYGASGDVRNEESTPNPVSMYGVTKWAAEQHIHKKHPNAISLRFATLFGISPRMRNDLMPNDFVHRAVTERSIVLFDAASVRTFLHLDDAIEAYALAVEKREEMRGKVFNVGSSELNHSKRELAEMVRDVTGCAIIDSSLADPDRRDFIINFDRIAALGFKPRWSVHDGLEQLARLYGFYRPFLHYRTI